MRRLAMGMALWALFLVPGLSQALGLGDIEVRSALNQPLDAEIELVSVRPGELEDLQVRLAPEALYNRLGIERTGLVTELNFRPETRPDGRHVIRVTTRNPAREPFVNFLVEATWPAGRLVREYTLLLDPPVMFEQQTAAPARAPAPAPARDARPAAPRPAAPRAEAPRAAAPDTYRVQRGDTLWNVASTLRPSADVSVEQMMLALLRANPEAFTDNNINNLRSGMVLRVPDQAEINRMSHAEARREVSRQNALWQEYRARVAGETQPQMEVPPGMASEAPGARSATESAVDEDARLEILGVRDQDAAARAEQDLALVRETAEARGREAEELRARVEELEALLERRERLLELTNQELAELQTRLGEPVAPVELPEPTEALETTDGAPVPGEDTVVAAGEDAVVDDPDAVADARDGEPDAVSEVDRMAATAEEETPAPPVAEETRPAAPVAPAAQEQPRPVSLVDQLMASPNALMIVGLILLLVLLLIWLMVRRMARGRSASVSPAARSTPSEPTLNAGAMGSLAAAGGAVAAGAVAAAARSDDEKEDEAEEEVSGPVAEAVTETESDVMSGGQEMEAGAVSGVPLSEDHDEIVNDDTIAEADVYLAYGLYSQAEDLLKKSLSEHPERVDYRFKLAETYFATKNTAAFEENARQMHDVLADRPSRLWERVQAMGQELNPDNLLFSGALALDFADSGTAGPGVDLDLDIGDLEDSLDDVDLGPSSDVADETILEPAPMDVLAEAEGTLQEGPATAGDDALEFDLGDLDLDADSLDVDLLDDGPVTGAEQVSPGDAPAVARDLDETLLESAPALDLPGMDVNLDDTLVEADVESPRGVGVTEDDTQILEEDFSDLDFLAGDDDADELTLADDESADLPSGDEVSTKLDLARAYIDMGDAEGARSTLEEVLAEGNDDQKREAQALIDQLS